MDERAVYTESPRGFMSTAILSALLLAGFLVDAARGGAWDHLIAWIVAAVIVLGVDLAIVRTIRGMYTITVTPTDLRVGEQIVPRVSIAGVTAIPQQPRVLGRTPGTGLPKSIPGLALRLDTAEVVVVATKRPDELRSALGFGAVHDEVRAAEPADLALLDDIAYRADALFRVAGFDLPEGREPSVEVAQTFVVGEPAFGYVEVGVVDGQAYVCELGVIPARMRQGFGSALLDAACAWGREHGYREVTLTTFAEVEWNAPFYRARGFLDAPAPGPELAQIRAKEAADGLDDCGPRIAMAKTL
jgi:GNAT superfamily N-acetyltransferase